MEHTTWHGSLTTNAILPFARIDLFQLDVVAHDVCVEMMRHECLLGARSFE